MHSLKNMTMLVEMSTILHLMHYYALSNLTILYTQNTKKTATPLTEVEVDQNCILPEERADGFSVCCQF